MTDSTARRALVLGGSRGIGAAVAQRLGADGFDVSVVGRSASTLDSSLASIIADVTIPEGRDAIAAHIADHGFPHVVVCAVHVREPWSRVSKVDPTSYGRAVDIHLGHVAELAALSLEGQRADGYGRWIFLSSLVAPMGGHGQSVYAAQKAASEAFSRSLAIEEGRYGITSNVLVPGVIGSDHMATTYTAEQLRSMGQASAVGRIGTPEEVAHAVSFLAHPLGGFVTGASIPVTGGAELSWWLGDVLRANVGGND